MYGVDLDSQRDILNRVWLCAHMSPQLHGGPSIHLHSLLTDRDSPAPLLSLGLSLGLLRQGGSHEYKEPGVSDELYAVWKEWITEGCAVQS